MKILSSAILIVLLLTSLAFATDYCGDANCQGCWPMDVDEEPLTDSSANTNTCAYTGDPAYATADPPDSGDGATAGFQTGYYVLDGDDGFDCGNDSSLAITGTDLSIIAWIYPVSYGAYDPYISKYKSSYAREGYQVNTNDDTNGMDNSLLVYNNHSGKEYKYQGNLADNEWEHIAAVLDSGVHEMYLNDDVDTNDLTGVIGDSGTGINFLIGYIGATFITGRFCQVAIFDRDLSAVEVAGIRANGLSEAAAAGRTRRFF